MSPCAFCKQQPCGCIRDDEGRQIAPPEPAPDPAYVAHRESGSRSNKHPEVPTGLVRPGSMKFAGIFQQGTRAV
jgi:hypothetical protein